MEAQHHQHIYDWNSLKKVSPLSQKQFELVDETLRDGIQSPSARDPGREDKIELLHLMDQLGVGLADIGLPGAGPRAQDDVTALAQEISASRLKIRPTCAARTTAHDIRPIADIVQKTGVPIEVYAFVGSSPIRLFAEGWSVEKLRGLVVDAVSFCVKEQLEVCLVTEDTTRSRPDVLDPLFRRAVDLGVRRFCLCDTVGHVTPDGIRNLFDWTTSLVRGMGVDVKLDFHGHNDRGLAVSNALFAIEYGADRVHGTGLGVGERVGNASMDQILVNLKLLGEWEPDLTALLRYCETVSRACDVPIPNSYPLAGRDAFRTGTGVHAAAIVKAHKKGDRFMADRVYSGVPAGMFGRHQEIEIGHMSGVSNVLFWLESHELPQEEGLVQAIFTKAKSVDRLLAEEEIMAIVRDHGHGDPRPPS